MGPDLKAQGRGELAGDATGGESRWNATAQGVFLGVFVFAPKRG